MSLRSMTAFSTAETAGERVFWRWDMRSVNARGLDIKIRLPQGLESLEPKTRRLIHSRIARGSIMISLVLEPSVSAQDDLRQDAVSIEAVLDSYERLQAACEARGIKTAPARIEALMGLPALSRREGPNLTTPALEAETEILATLEEALKSQLLAREAEGARLYALFDDQLSQIDGLVKKARLCAGEAVEALRKRLRDQLGELLEDHSALDKGRLEQELALLASKADVREELDRLDAHISAARELLDSGIPAGRKLEFLTQEFNREANTLCSKSATEDMTRIGLNLKSVIEQLREQAANVE